MPSTIRIPFLLSLCILLLTTCSKMDPETRRRMAELNRLVADKDCYIQRIQSQLDSLTSCLESVDFKADPARTYRLSKEVFRVSHLYSFEYAECSASRMLEASLRMGDVNIVAEARMLQAFNYARAGFFHEAQALLDNIPLDSVSDAVHADILVTRGRVYHDLADYTHDAKYTPYYNKVGNGYLRQSLVFVTDSVTRNYVLGKILLKSGRPREAKRYYQSALRHCSEDKAEMRGILFSTLAYICRLSGEPEAAARYYIDACEVDVRNAFRDVNALRGLAEMLYMTYDDIDNSAAFINLAVENAQAYGTRSRINNMGALMPLFVGQKLERETTAKHWLLGLACFVAVLAIVLAIVLRRYHARNRELDRTNRELDRTNRELEDVNHKLEDANRLKETYLGFFLDTQSELSLELNNFAMVASQKIKMQQYDALKKLIDQLEKKHNKAEVLSTFDRVFLTIYPTFIEEFNALLLPEYRMEPKDEGEMPTQMRIFALVRLGITDNNRIAGALNYSYNTVHNYRVRVRNMSSDARTFEEKVVRIGQ